MKIKAILIIMVAINTSAGTQNEEDEIIKIRSYFKQIETSIKQGELKTITLDFENPKSNSYGTTTYYSDSNGVRKIVYDLLINEENNQKTSFYIRNNKIFFAYHVSVAPRVIDQTKTEYHYTENRYYFNNGAAIRCLRKGYVVDSDSKNSVEKLSARTPNERSDCHKSLEIMQLYKELVEALKTENTK